jgi:segregation and condensation protein B
MIENAGKGYAMRVRPVFEEKVMPLIPETDLPKSVLKTLALIAHEQPIKQTTVVKLRGNRVYHYLHRLEELGFIQGRPDGRTRLLTTTPKFHEYFRLQDVRTLNLGAVAGDTEPKQTILEIPPEAQCEAEDD